MNPKALNWTWCGYVLSLSQVELCPGCIRLLNEKSPQLSLAVRFVLLISAVEIVLMSERVFHVFICARSVIFGFTFRGSQEHVQ